MHIHGTVAAFHEVIKERGIYKALGVDRSTVSNWRRGVQHVTLDKMEDVLIRAGATVIVEKIWDVPKKL